METIMNFLQQTGFSMIPENWKMLVMIAISLVLAYLAIVKKFEPLLLLPISFGMLLTNLPGAEMFHEQLFAGGHVNWDLLAGKTVEIDGVATTISAGLIDYLYLGVKLGIYPCLIFMGVGAGTDFEPLLANPKTLLLGAAAQLGIFITFIGAKALFGFTAREAAATGIIGGADGRATVTGTIDLTVCHASRMPGRPLVYTQHSMPFEQTVTLSGEMGDALSASAQTTDAAVALEGKEDERILRAEVSLKVGVQALREQRQSVVADVFASAGEQLTPSGERVTYRSASVNEQTAESGRLQMILPEGTPRIKTVLAAFVQPVLVGASAQGGKLNADMLLRATLIYMTEDSGIPVAYTAEEPARMAFAADAQPEDVLTLSALRVEPSAVAGDRAEIRYVISLRAEGTRYGQAFVVTEVAQEPAPAAESVLAMYRTQPDERLWDVMKRYRLPRESLLALNEQLTADEEETLPEGTCVIAYKR